MKKILYISFIAILSFTGCVKFHPQDQTITPYDYEKFKQTDLLSVTVPDGKAAIVTYYGDTMAVLLKSDDIMVPYTGTPATTKADGDNPIVVTYEDVSSLTDNNKFSTWGDLFQTIAFEDSKNNDYDYNDMVLHVRIGRGNSTSKGGFNIQPVALGSTKTISLGAYITVNKVDNYRIIFSTDVRKDLFDNTEGFINTVEETGTGIKKWFRYLLPELGTSINITKVNWFILVDNTELFAVTEDFYSKSFDSQGRPFGIVFTNIHDPYTQITAKGTKQGTYGSEYFSYPKEYTNIEEVYPGFVNLMDASTSVSFREVFANPIADKSVRVMQLYEHDTYGLSYNSTEPKNVYYLKPDGGNFYYNDGGEKTVYSINEILH